MSSFRSQRLLPEHDLDAFSSGNEELDRWLRRSARHAEAANTGRTFAWTRPDSIQVVAYFTLAAHLLRRAEVPKRVGRGSPDAIPAILLARLALGRSLQGRGLGGQLLRDALERAVEASERAAARLVVVDAIDEDARAFYQHFGFVAIPGSRRLVRKVSDVAAGLRGK
ncbi:MAG: GNAT family N-acetyltransferase [Candidatus Dormibacteria bacterium]